MRLPGARNNKSNNLSTVSYTHLDVYKRQQSARERPVGKYPTRCAPPTHGRQALGMVDLRDSLVESRRRIRAGEVEASHLAYEAASPVATDEVGAAAVSYTHLDVYKRQV